MGSTKKVLVWISAFMISMGILMPPSVYASEEQVQLTEIEPALNESTQPEADADLNSGATDSAKVELEIEYSNQIHSVIDPDYPNERIILYCMNNELYWPHVAPSVPNVPHYMEGYLTPEHFNDPAEYRECVRKLRKILFAGYPHNTERLYKIVDSDAVYVPTEEEFNKMLIPLPQLIVAFPQLGHHIFTLKDKDNQEHLSVLTAFVKNVKGLSSDWQAANGLTRKDITAMPFYKAASCMIMETDDPLSLFPVLFPNSYFVTEEQAYNSTQNAVWTLLKNYGVPDNNFSDITNDTLAQVLIQYAEHGELLETEPEYAEIKIDGDLTFSYDEKDGMWHTGKLKIIEPLDYHGVYDLSLPEGVTLLDSKLTHIYGNEEYELVSSREVQPEEIFSGTANYYWMEDFKQYSPVGDDAFQRMAGAVVRDKQMKFSVLYGINELGDLKITKSVIGDSVDSEQEFRFTLTLPGFSINGTYGDLNFTNGVGEFSLKNGESKTVKNLPAGAAYIITETPIDGYQVTSQNDQGIIAENQTISVHFTNTKIIEGDAGGGAGPDADPPAAKGALQITKSVIGDSVDSEQEFHFTLTLPGFSINGTYGDLNFTNGVGEFSLKNGESKTVKNLPAGAAYIITETPIDGYQVTSQNDQGTIAKNQTIPVSFINVRKSDHTEEQGDSDTLPEPTVPPMDEHEPSDPPVPRPVKPQEIPSGQDRPHIPKTGDASALGLWLGVFVVSLFGLYYQISKRKRNNIE